jgi:hypothetical protein
VVNTNISSHFTGIIDDLILTSNNDTKLAETIRWIDMQSKKKGISFYDMTYIIADKQLSKKRAQQWLMSKKGYINNNDKKFLNKNK